MDASVADSLANARGGVEKTVSHFRIGLQGTRFQHTDGVTILVRGLGRSQFQSVLTCTGTMRSPGRAKLNNFLEAN